MPDVPWTDVLTQITSFFHTSIIAGYIPYVLGFGIGAWIVTVLVRVFLGR